MSIESDFNALLASRNDVATQSFREALLIRPRYDLYAPFPNAGGRFVHQDRFTKLPQLPARLTTFTNPVTQAEMVAAMKANHDWTIEGTNASDDDVTFYASGGIELETDGAANDQVILRPHSGTSISQLGTLIWPTSQEIMQQWAIKLGPDITSQIVWAGFKLTNTPTVVTDDDQVLFRYQDGVNGGRWQAIYSIAGTDTTIDTGTIAGVSAAVADTAYRLRIVVDSSRVARMYWNSILVATSDVLSSVSLIPFFGLQGTAAAARKVRARHVTLVRNYA